MSVLMDTAQFLDDGRVINQTSGVSGYASVADALRILGERRPDFRRIPNGFVEAPRPITGATASDVFQIGDVVTFYEAEQ